MPLHAMDGSEAPLGIVLESYKQELIALKANVEQLRSQLEQARSVPTGEQETVTALSSMTNYKDDHGKIDMERYTRDLKDVSYQARQTTRALHGVALLMKETGMLKGEQEETYRNIQRTIHILYQAQRAYEAFDAMTRLTQATNPAMWVLTGISLVGRTAYALGSANRQTGSGV